MSSNCFRFLDQNFLDTNVLSGFVASSENTSFPKENVQNFNRRGKLWRSNGAWDLTTGTTTIVFRETTAVDLTATVAASLFSSTASFLIGIKTAFETVGASVYTITVDSTTGKINIASDGAGGGGILELQWADGASATMAGILGFSTVANDVGALTYLADILKISTGETLTFDLGMSSNPRAFAMIAARNTAINISPTADLRLQGNSTDIWTSPEFDKALTIDSQTIGLLHDPINQPQGLHTEALRFWRIAFNDNSNTKGFIEIGAIYLGDVLTLVKGTAQFPFVEAEVDRSQTIISEGGQFFTDQREQSREFSSNWKFINNVDKESLQFLFQKFGKFNPLFISFDSDAVFSSSFNKNLRLVQFASEPSFELIRPDIFTSRMSFIEVL